MKRIINIFIAVVALALASCYSEDIYNGPINEEIVIELSSATSRAEHNATESYVEHIDIFIFENEAGTPGATKHYERQQLNNSPSLTLNARRSSFAEGATYFVYLIANSNLAQAEFEAMTDYNDLLDAKQEDPMLHLSGLALENVPAYFLMDAAATNIEGSKSIILNNGNTADNTSLKATLRRAAAKVVVNITAGENVAFRNFTSAQGSEGGLYYVRNLSYDAFLLAEAKSDEDIEAKVRTTSKTNSDHFKWNPTTTPKSVSLVVYAYPNHWSNASILEHETCIVMNLPMSYTEDGTTTDYFNNWYKIPMSDDQTLRRNNYYGVNIEISRPGATSEARPIDIENISYEVEEWTNQTINVGGEDKPKYLMVNRKEMEMYNTTTDLSTLEFASSSPVTVSLKRVNNSVDVYYINKYGDKVYENLNITGTTDGGIAGNIAIDTKQLPSKNAIRYFTLVVTNQEGLSKEVAVTQYPLVYITNILSYYSYRSDFLGSDTSGTLTANHYENRSQYNRFAVNYNNGNHSYSAGGSKSTGFFVSKVVASTYTSGNNKGLSDVDFYTANRTGDFNNPYNARMYHIRITATSSEYVLGRPKITNGVTDPGEDNAKMVSPSFMIASRLGTLTTSAIDLDPDYSGLVEPSPGDYGATWQQGVWGNGSWQWPSGSDRAGYNAALEVYEQERAQRESEAYLDVYAEHAKQYVEVYKDPTTGQTVHLGDWRLPTKAELEIIYQFQGTDNDPSNADAIDYLLNAGAYFSASGPVSNPKSNMDGTSVRCIRDVY